MTIAERKAREASERENPWRSRKLIRSEPAGMICELRRSDLTDFGSARFIFRDGDWYRIEPPEKLPWFYLMEFRPTGTILCAHRVVSVVSKAEYKMNEYFGVRGLRKPRPYKLYWRADD